MTDKYAVIGNPIAHSKSPQIHALFAQQTGQDISYEAILAPLDGFTATIKKLRNEGYKGCNVTVPFKFEAFELAKHNLTERAKDTQAVNTLKFEADSILGDNTDGVGLIRDITQNLGYDITGKQVLLMGAGGAAYGVVLPLLGAGAKLNIVNRTHKKAQQLSQVFAQYGHIVVCNYSELDRLSFDCIINATSAGLFDEIPPSPPFAKGGADILGGGTSIPPFAKGGLGGIFAPGAFAYDMMYGRETPFMKFARAHGAAIVADGLGMLVEQAAESFFLWRGIRPETASVINKLRDQK